MLYELTEEDMRQAWHIAQLRNAPKRPYQNRRAGKRSDIDTHMLGLKAEIAFARITGLPLDESVLTGGDVTDFRVANLRIDVKGRVRTDGLPLDLALISDSPTGMKSNVYILAEVQPGMWDPQVRFIGWTDQVIFALHGRVVQMGGSRWAIQEAFLWPMSALIPPLANFRMRMS